MLYQYTPVITCYKKKRVIQQDEHAVFPVVWLQDPSSDSHHGTLSPCPKSADINSSDARGEFAKLVVLPPSQYNVPHKDMFTAVLDALATLTEQGPGEKCKTLTAVGPLSFTGQAVIHVDGRVTCSEGIPSVVITRTMRVIFGRLNIDQNKWRGKTFEIFHNEEMIGRGDVLRLDPPSMRDVS